jgi:hypothetical protein
MEFLRESLDRKVMTTLWGWGFCGAPKPYCPFLGLTKMHRYHGGKTDDIQV